MNDIEVRMHGSCYSRLLSPPPYPGVVLGITMTHCVKTEEEKKGLVEIIRKTLTTEIMGLWFMVQKIGRVLYDWAEL